MGGGFHKLLEKRQVQFDGTCASGLKSIVLAVCDYLEQIRGSECKRQSQPHLQAAIIAVVRRLIVEGLKACGPESEVTPELAGAAASWAIYGAASEWAQTPGHCSSEEIAETVTRLVAPLLPQRTAGIG